MRQSCFPFWKAPRDYYQSTYLYMLVYYSLITDQLFFCTTTAFLLLECWGIFYDAMDFKISLLVFHFFPVLILYYSNREAIMSFFWFAMILIINWSLFLCLNNNRISEAGFFSTAHTLSIIP